ncbi:MAG: 23S rRNA (guanosine(2251)-2'-O)-methyltransferase RlmB [Deltaproteobacteria bacterium]|nr:23S rRNA (guanosine(2251)-2'-O)-methyltransferase RlmB [Deltaproteobacteria bacterium]RLB32339.1 MAG: 23S rRNA (guanosine(2251)-2'-O)-methyltransferase RlmB [Deltaproteobacteria bacterium]
MGKKSKEAARFLIPGFHAVKESVLEGRAQIEEIWIREGKRGARVHELLEISKQKNIPVFFKTGAEMDRRLKGVAHQGISAVAKENIFSDLKELVYRCENSFEKALIVAADHITDEGNLGALIRTAAFFGVHGLILPRDRSAKITQRVLKTCSGAHAHLCIVEVVNLGRTLDFLSEKDYWIIGAAGESPTSVYEFDWDRDLVLILGREDKGISRSTRSRCQQLVGIQGSGKISSLNVAIAGAVFLSEIVRQRRKEGPP